MQSMAAIAPRTYTQDFHQGSSLRRALLLDSYFRGSPFAISRWQYSLDACEHMLLGLLYLAIATVVFSWFT